MKTKKLKGFTLIELIVVMAIFGAIMAAAMSFITPASRIWSNSEAEAAGSTTINNVGDYLKTQITSAEYLHVFNDVSSNEAAVDTFTQAYYTGTLRTGSTPSSPNYGEGIVHVLQIDNRPDPATGYRGTIKKWDYEVSFNPSGTAISCLTPAGQELAVNRTYYDSYDFCFIPGTYSSTDAFNQIIQDVAAGTVDITALETDTLMNMTSKQTAFTIRATTKKNINNKRYSFVSSTAMSLVNLYNRTPRSGLVRDRYFAVGSKQKVDGSGNLVFEADGTTPVMEAAIVDRSAHGTGGAPVSPYFTTDSGINVALSPSGDLENEVYTFVYSYGAEIDTD